MHVQVPEDLSSVVRGVQFAGESRTHVVIRPCALGNLRCLSELLQHCNVCVVKAQDSAPPISTPSLDIFLCRQFSLLGRTWKHNSI